jgi:hypothetical protein
LVGSDHLAGQDDRSDDLLAAVAAHRVTKVIGGPHSLQADFEGVVIEDIFGYDFGGGGDTIMQSLGPPGPTPNMDASFLQYRRQSPPT